MITITVVLVIGALLSPYFLSEANFRNILITGAVVSVLAVGQFMVIVTAGIDLSVGAVASFSTVASAVLMAQGRSAWSTVALSLLACGVIGLVNGALVVYARITPFIATLGMLGVVQGLAYLVQGGTYVRIENQAFIGLFSGDVGGVPRQVLIFALVTVIFAVLMRWSTFGRQLYAIGGNAEAAHLSGLPVKRNVVAAYVISAALASIAGFMLAAQLGEGSSRLGQGLELDSIAAAVVGGASLFGGLGSPAAAVLGGLLIGTISNIMNLRGVAAEPQLIIKGFLILFAVFVTSGKGADLRGSLGAMAKSVLFHRRPLGSAGTPATDEDSPAVSPNGESQPREPHTRTSK
ncbi:ABC transporter permease [Cellulomonas fimi]|uniref:ABC transporter permease n=1 Tax=Cellulomonas fimi TaxID=1708 RepID=A0A7Y0M156_CELFI|nr:ABC transporter permease [Cellulomonas fimi]NMR21696.1 ABC transporter permease [Cellulomonas fimi]